MCEEGCFSCGLIDKSLCRYIKDYDRYGHPVKLNFNKNGPTHNTFLGGIGSLVYYFVIFLVVTTSLAASGDDQQPIEGDDSSSKREMKLI